MQQKHAALENLIIEDGWLNHCRRIQSPNYNQRPDQCVSLLVVHNISLPPGQFGGCYIEDFFCNQLAADSHPYFVGIANVKASAHLLINRSGDITQFVNFKHRAWHAGTSLFQGDDNCNNFSIGIELEGTDIIPYTHVQYDALIQITKLLMAAYPLLTEQRIVGHCDIAPTRKTDPGPLFDWQYYRQALKT